MDLGARGWRVCMLQKATCVILTAECSQTDGYAQTAPLSKAHGLAAQCKFLGLGWKRKCTKPVPFGGRSAPRTNRLESYLDPRREDTTKTCNRKSLIILILFRVQFQSLKESSIPKSQKEQNPSL